MEKYSIIGELGKGSYGLVYKVFNKKTNTIDALKLTEKFNILEYHALFTFKHPNLIQGQKFTRRMINNTLTYFIETQLADTTLDNYQYKNEDKNRLIYEFMSAVNFIHKNNFVHCDLKPSNVFILNDTVKLGDFGLLTPVSSHNTICQTYNYSPPEYVINSIQFNLKNLDKLKFYINKLNLNMTNKLAGDIWAVACVIYYILERKDLFINSEDFVDNYIKFLDDPNKELYKKLSNTTVQYHNMLLKMLHVQPSDRTVDINDIFLSSPIYRNYNILTFGYLDYNLYNGINSVKLEPDVINIYKMYNAKIISYFAFLDLFFRSYGNVNVQNLQLYCFIMSQELYDFNLYTKFKGYPNYEDVRYKVVESINGHVVFDNPYNYAFSLKSIYDILDMTLDSETYLNTDWKMFFYNLELKETLEEKNSRQAKDSRF